MKKTMKKIAAIGVATAVAATSLTGVMAANLGDYPAPFVKDGVADFSIVIGENAATSDVIGAIDIATNLQASSVTKENVAIAGETTSMVEGGMQVEGAGSEEYLALGENLTETFDDQDLSFLADGEIVDEDGEDASGNDLAEDEYEYDQTLTLGSTSQILFADDVEDEESPIIYLDAYGGPLYNLSVQFDDPVDFTSLEDGETFQVAGKVFTVGIDTDNNKLILFGSDATTFLGLNEPVTIEQDGKTFEVEIVGGNDQADNGNGNVIISVNGVRETLEEGDSETVNGLDVYIQDLFVTNIPTLTASANVFVGSNEIEVSQSGVVKVDSETLDGYKVFADDLFNQTSQLDFVFTIADVTDDNGYTDEDKYLVAGESMVDPLLGTFEVNFAGMSLDLMDDAKDHVKLEAGSDTFTVTFTNEDGETISFDMFELDSSDDLALAEDFKENGTLVEGDYFIGFEGDRYSIFEVTEIDVTDAEVTFTDLGSDKEFIVDNNTAVDDTQFTSITVTEVPAGKDTVTLTGAAATKIMLEYGSELQFSYNLSAGANGEAYFSLVEDVADANEVGYVSATTVNLTLAPETGSNPDLELSETTSVLSETDEDDNKIGYTAFGTYAIMDEDGFEFNAYLPDEEEVEYNVFIAPVGSSVTISGGSSSVTSTVLNPIGVGATMLDRDVTLATANKNLIVVGGPAINSVASELLGSPADPSTVFAPGTAVVELFDLDSGNVAMLVAGYAAIDTQEASRRVALQDSDLFVDGSTSASLTVTGLRSSTISTN